jgi:hypothetical protein
MYQKAGYSVPNGTFTPGNGPHQPYIRGLYGPGSWGERYFCD